MMVKAWLCLLLMARVMTRATAAEKITRCHEDALLFVDGLKASEKWAMQMFDSATKIPDGLLYGNVKQLGNFDECLGARAPEFQGKYCRGSMKVRFRGTTHQLPILMKWAFCVPSSCSGQEVQELVDKLVPRLVSSGVVNVSLAADIKDEDCYTASKLQPRDVAIQLILALVLTLVTAATILEMVKGSKWRVVRVFSARSTFSQLFSTSSQSGEISCLHGIRVGSMLWIILGHRYSNNLEASLSNYVSAGQWLSKVSSHTVIGGFLGVDSFFFMSGLLMCYVFLRDMAQGASFNILKFYLYRYIRLAPPMMAVILFYISVMPYLGSGPLWNNVVTPMSEHCASQWWINALYVHNIVQTPTMCVPQTWYLAVDMQLAWLSPLVLLPLRYISRSLVFILLILLTAVSCVVPFTLTYVNNFPWSFDLMNKVPVDGDAFVKYIYMIPYSRATPYIVGIMLGYLLHQSNMKSSKISNWMVFTGYLFSTATCLSVIYTLSIAYQPSYQYNPVEAAFYAGFHRLGWSLGLAWIVFACVKGYGGPVNAILSWKMWAPLGRLCYGAYLTQFIVLQLDLASERNPVFFSDFYSIHSFLGDVPMVFFLALVLYTFVEGPTTSGLRILMKKGSKELDTESAKIQV